MRMFIKVWLLILISLSYCYIIGKVVPRGFTRLITILPVIYLFVAVPLGFTCIHFRGLMSFFISWLAIFKLLLFAFGKPPLCCHPQLPFLHFVAIACLPIQIMQQNHKSSQEALNSRKLKEQNPGQNSLRDQVIKATIFSTTIWITFNYGNHIHQYIVRLMILVFVYIGVQGLLACIARGAKLFLGLELETQFKQPLSSTSLQDFWGRRWNLIVSNILRPTVYYPSRDVYTKIIGRKRATYAAVMSTFIVSALMHELIFYYMGHMRPTFEVTCFFVIHGFCVCVEIAAKKHVAGAWEIQHRISTVATLSFVLVTAFWLFLPALQRMYRTCCYQDESGLCCNMHLFEAIKSTFKL